MARAIPLLPAEIRRSSEVPDHDRRARDRSGSVAHGRLGTRSRRGTSSTWTPTARIRFPNFPREYDEAVKRYGAEFVAKNGHAAVADRRDLREARRGVHAEGAVLAREHQVLLVGARRTTSSDAHVPFHAALNYDGQLTGQCGHSLAIRDRAVRALPRDAAASSRSRSRRSATPRDFIFDTLIASFPLAQPMLDADKAAVAGRELYDDRYFTMFFGKVRPILERRLADAITGVGVDDHRGLDRGGPAGAAARAAADAAEGPARAVVRRLRVRRLVARCRLAECGAPIESLRCGCRHQHSAASVTPVAMKAR